MRSNSIATVFQQLVMGGRLADIRLLEPAQWSRRAYDPNVLSLPLREIDVIFSCLQALAIHVQSPILATLAKSTNLGSEYITKSNSLSVRKRFLLRRYFSNIRDIVSSKAVTPRSPGPNMLLLP